MERGQMKLSFGMIFSIILIIIFITFASYGITKFLNLQKEIQIRKFTSDLQFDVDKIWRSSGSEKYTYILPGKITQVCFKDPGERGDKNMELKLKKGFGLKDNIDNLDIEKITNEKEPFCIPTENGKVKMRLKKDFGEALVTITAIE